jgi:itaconate CoA-transferase
MMRPLDGITVIAIEQAIAAPFCTRQLADLGARVIKIERPGTGDFARHYDDRVNGLASHFVWTNRSKESLALDLKHPEARNVLSELVGRADVLVQNLAPGATERMRFGYRDLATAHPRLIVCDISGYGSGGPYSDKKAYDLMIQGECGFLSVSGTAADPCKAGISVSDISAGMYAYSSILAALLQRSRTGLGTHIEVSLFETSVEWMGFPLYYGYQDASPPARTGAAHATIYPYGPFAAGDGKEVMLGLQNEREWRIFCEQVLRMPALVANPEFSSNARRVASRSQLRTIILDTFASLSVQEVVDRLDHAGIANARMNSVAEVWAHPQLKARDRWSEVSTSVGKIPALKPPAMLLGIVARMDPVPELGEHTDGILRELGASDERIAGLRRAGIIG